MKFPAGFVLQVAENERRAWWGMREAICCLQASNMSIVAQQKVWCGAGTHYSQGQTSGREAMFFYLKLFKILNLSLKKEFSL